jgi:hypothetical protein
MLRFLRENGGRAISISQCDCTPASTEETVIVGLGGKWVVRRGRRMSEYLLHRLFARSADLRQRVVFGHPQRLADKTASAHHAAARPPLLFRYQHGCETINITHLIFDGALWDSLSRSIYSERACAVDMEAPSADCDSTWLKLCSWFVRTPCVRTRATTR